MAHKIIRCKPNGAADELGQFRVVRVRLFEKMRCQNIKNALVICEGSGFALFIVRRNNFHLLARCTDDAIGICADETVSCKVFAARHRFQKKRPVRFVCKLPIRGDWGFQIGENLGINWNARAVLCQMVELFALRYDHPERAKVPIGSQGCSFTGAVFKTARIFCETYFFCTTTSYIYSSNHLSVIIKNPLSPIFSPQLFSTLHFLGLPDASKSTPENTM